MTAQYQRERTQGKKANFTLYPAVTPRGHLTRCKVATKPGEMHICPRTSLRVPRSLRSSCEQSSQPGGVTAGACTEELAAPGLLGKNMHSPDQGAISSAPPPQPGFFPLPPVPHVVRLAPACARAHPCPAVAASPCPLASTSQLVPARPPVPAAASVARSSPPAPLLLS